MFVQHAALSGVGGLLGSRPRQVMPPPAAQATPEERQRQHTNTVAKRLGFASALNELSGQYGLMSGAHLTMLMAVTGAGELVAGEMMVAQSVAAALAEFIATPIAGQLSDNGGRRRVLVCSALGSAALRGLVVINPCVVTVWIAKFGDALVRIRLPHHGLACQQIQYAR